MPHPELAPARPARIAAIAAALFGLSFFWTVASVNVPHEAGDAELLEWWQQDANVRSGMISMMFAILTATLLVVVSNHLLLTVGPRFPHLSAFARSMAAAFTATLLVSGALRGVIGHLVDVNQEPLPGLDVLRYTTALNYTVLGVVVMGTFALFVLSMAVLVLRSGQLDRWLGFVGLGCGIITLGAVVALMGAFTVPVAISGRCAPPPPCGGAGLLLPAKASRNGSTTRCSSDERVSVGLVADARRASVPVGTVALWRTW
jgi:hypothetical protein